MRRVVAQTTKPGATAATAAKARQELREWIGRLEGTVVGADVAALHCEVLCHRLQVLEEATCRLVVAVDSGRIGDG